MSDTPETDRNMRPWSLCPADFARKLERERDDLRNAIRAFMTDFERIEWGFDGDCGSAELADKMFTAIIKKP